jgi:DNA-directed RNA polymerase specialized sigma24 family protein
MRLIKPNNTEPVSLEDIFAARYDWLLKWALHFADGNHATAEDLVQDTFVRFIVAQPDVKDPENAEPLLYTYLKYVHLAYQRRTRRHLLHHLTIVDFDSIQLAVRENPSTDAIDIQDELRRVVAYLSWRKETAKSASILILRFLHGYRREEIMLVALISKQAVANGLLLARDETKRYLEDATSMRVLHHSAPPDPLPRQIAVPLDQLLLELRTAIFDACQTSCLSKEELLQHYTRLNPKPLDTVLLAHIVSCKRCLDLINDFHQIPRLDQRSPDDATASRRRAKSESKKRGRGDATEPKLVLGKAYQRLRELYDHRPESISIAVNGHILAARDISSSVNRLEVEIHRETRIEFIEVLSEQGICLLAIPVVSTPPQIEPELRHEAFLGDACKLELLVKFTSNGPLIEVFYHDESFVSEQEFDAEGALVLLQQEAMPSALDMPSLLPETIWRTRLKRRLKHIFTPALTPIFTSAVILGLASIVCFGIWWTNRLHITPHEVLTQAMQWDHGVPGNNRAGVIYQKVRVRTSTQTVERSIYHDAQGKRRLKPQPLSPNLDQLRSRLNGAGVPWNEPLSAGSYQVWHDHQQVRRDRLVRSGENLLTLTTTVEGGDIAQESLTVRESDFHPVGRTIEFRETGTVEIAELNYDVMPWGEMNDELFEPLSDGPRASAAHMHASPAFHLPHVLSDLELDEAELAARLVLNQLGADRAERIDLVRSSDGIQVKGIVATSERKNEIESRLRLVPHVIPVLYTFQEFAEHTHGTEGITGIQTASVIAGQTPLEKYLLDKGRSREDVRRVSVQLFNDAASLTQDGKAIDDLLQRFDQAQRLTPEAHEAFTQLLARHQASLLSSLDEEDKLVAEIGIPSGDKRDIINGAPNFLRNEAEENIQLCKELISASDDSARTADAIVPDLLTSIRRLRVAAHQADTNNAQKH